MLFCTILTGMFRSFKDNMRPPHPWYIGPTAHVLFSQPCHSPAVGSWEAKQRMCEDLWLEIARKEMPGLWDHCFCGGEGVWPCWLLADPAASVSTHLSAAALTQYPDVWEREGETGREGEREGVFLLPKRGSQTWISNDVKGVNLCVWCFSIRCHLSSLSTVTVVILNHRHVTHASTVLLLRMTNQRKWSISD